MWSWRSMLHDGDKHDDVEVQTKTNYQYFTWWLCLTLVPNGTWGTCIYRKNESDVLLLITIDYTGYMYTSLNLAIR